MTMFRENAIKYAARGLAVYAATLGLWTGIKYLDVDSQADVQQQELAVKSDKQMLEKDKDNLLVVEQQVGAKCLRLVKAYSDGGVLHREGFDASVGDIVKDPLQGCGDNSVKVGTDLGDYQRARADVSDSQFYLAEDQQDLKKVRVNSERSFGNLLDTTWEEALVLDVSAMLAGYFLMLITFED